MMEMNGWFITGTDTGVGKTVVTSLLAAVFHKQSAQQHSDAPQTICVWKPIQTGEPRGAMSSDSMRLVAGSGIAQTDEQTATFTFEHPLAPWMAALRVGQKVSYQFLVDEGRKRLRAHDYTLIEGAGGLAVPLTEHHLLSDLVVALKLPLLIVARAGVGTVNHTLLTIQAAQRVHIPIAGVILNDCTPLMQDIARENTQMIERFGGVKVLGVLPRLGEGMFPQTLAQWEAWRIHGVATMERTLALDKLWNERKQVNA